MERDYTEQMMLDEGYSADPKMRIGQLQDALLRNARYIVGIEMHTGKRSFEQGIEFFEKEGYQSHEVAEVETKRGTSDPTYLYYTLGKLQILKLREDYHRKMGEKFSLQEFTQHNFLKRGAPPIKIVRRALLRRRFTHSSCLCGARPGVPRRHSCRRRHPLLRHTTL